ncbi:MAG: hypothetical protein BWY48_00225 [Parcubacteria group bacterium ADurb.Bin305]|mgnify:FL=1|jgi:hypothetical protein|nr:hypothetical protein [Candidatus Paceibacterota bacterium]MDD3434675.1 hypothetical protein [Candidatus Paceibacterota bacterium]OQA44181.1 MAG: hypothetical protein BWY48_00225 [Parcubacteria group bacterium ADurb.Bin305]
MTIIYNNSSFKKSYSPVVIQPQRRHKRFSAYRAKKMSVEAGWVKTNFILFSPLITVIILWLFLFGCNIALDYQVYNLKKSLAQAEDELTKLQENSAEIVSLPALQDWAAQHALVPVDKMDYLVWKEWNLAQKFDTVINKF